MPETHLTIEPAANGLAIVLPKSRQKNLCEYDRLVTIDRNPPDVEFLDLGLSPVLLSGRVGIYLNCSGVGRTRAVQRPFCVKIVIIVIEIE